MLRVSAIVAFAVGWAWPGMMLFAVVRVGREAPAAASGAVQVGAFAGGRKAHFKLSTPAREAYARF